MKKIILHWTGGNYFPCAFDKKFYHYLFDKNGEMYYGLYKPEDNEDCTDGKYAQHCAGGNTGAIGIALCAMGGFISPDNIGYAPITKLQLERALSFTAFLAKRYNIKIGANSVMTHYEFGLKNPKTVSAGKIDMIYLPPYPEQKTAQIGDFLRRKVQWYFGG